MSSRFVWSPVELAVSGRVLLGREASPGLLHRVLPVARHGLAFSRLAHHAVPPPGQKHKAHDDAEAEEPDFFAHDPDEVARSEILLGHARIFRKLVPIPLD